MRRGFDARPSDVVATGGCEFLKRTSARYLIVIVWLALISQSGCSERGLTPEDYSWASEDLTAVAILDARVALVVSRAGTIFRTDDAGETFRRVHSDPSAPLADLSMFDAESGWAVGDGRILATRDGGRSWRVQPLPEARADAQLRGVHALDADHALSVGLAGARLRTQNGGRHWEDRSEVVRVESVVAAGGSRSAPAPPPLAVSPEISFDADLHDVVCADEEDGHCVSLGGAGGVAYSMDRGESWIASRRLPLLPFEPIEMSAGAVELSREAIDRLTGLVERSSGRSDTSIRVEAVAGDGEIEGASRKRDPEALFEILEARALDAVGVLEGAGVAAERIRILGTPPWGYQDLLDDDPESLERYWRAQRASAPGVRIFVVDERPMHSGRFLDLHDGEVESRAEPILAVGAAGAAWRSLDGGESWGRADELGDTDLFAVGQDRSVLSVAGDRGTWHESMELGAEWEAPSWPEGLVVEERLEALDFWRDSGFGLIVGGAGLVLKRGAWGEDWRRIVASDP